MWIINWHHFVRKLIKIFENLKMPMSLWINKKIVPKVHSLRKQCLHKYITWTKLKILFTKPMAFTFLTGCFIKIDKIWIEKFWFVLKNTMKNCTFLKIKIFVILFLKSFYYFLFNLVKLRTSGLMSAPSFALAEYQLSLRWS